MKKITVFFLVTFLTFGISSTVWSVWLKADSTSRDVVKEKPAQFVQQSNTSNPFIAEAQFNSRNDKFRIIAPKSNWEQIFFEAINERIYNSKLSNLRLKALPKDDLEIRVWRGFGATLLEGFILKRENGQWLAIDLGWRVFKDRQNNQQVTSLDQKLDTPVSGWNIAWQKLIQAGLLTLPDAEEINCSAGVDDGTSYVVEYNLDNTYRTYLYDNPDYAECNEAKRMMEINKIISDEFYKSKFNLNE